VPSKRLKYYSQKTVTAKSVNTVKSRIYIRVENRGTVKAFSSITGLVKLNVTKLVYEIYTPFLCHILIKRTLHFFNLTSFGQIMADKHLAYRHFVDRHFVDRHFVDRHLTHRHLADRHLANKGR
jgi:hypothetical protein